MPDGTLITLGENPDTDDAKVMQQQMQGGGMQQQDMQKLFEGQSKTNPNTDTNHDPNRNRAMPYSQG